jgi:predicted transposase YbfD/YdcC
LSEVAYFVCEFLLPASLYAQAIRRHWAIENRSYYIRGGSFREDASRIRCNPRIFAASTLCARYTSCREN